MNTRRSRRGGALVAALVTLLVVMMVAGAIVRSRVSAHRQARQSQYELQAQWLAESGIERARAQLAKTTVYRGETWQPSLTVGGDASATATVEIRLESAERADQARRLIAIATYPNDRWRRVVVRREYTIHALPDTMPAAAAAPREENP
jgi:Tfp pilus assembly protein PilX